MLRTPEHSLLRDEPSIDLPRSFICFVEIFSAETAIRLKQSSTLEYLLHIVLVEFYKDFKMCLIQNGNRLVPFISVKIEKREDIIVADMGKPPRSVYGYSISQILDAKDTI